METILFDLVIYPGGHKTCIRSIEYFPSSNNFLATAAVDGTAKVCPSSDHHPFDPILSSCGIRDGKDSSSITKDTMERSMH